jgi:hypothetical protein
MAVGKIKPMRALAILHLTLCVLKRYMQIIVFGYTCKHINLSCPVFLAYMNNLLSIPDIV